MFKFVYLDLGHCRQWYLKAIKAEEIVDWYNIFRSENVAIAVVDSLDISGVSTLESSSDLIMLRQHDFEKKKVSICDKINYLYDTVVFTKINALSRFGAVYISEHGTWLVNPSKEFKEIYEQCGEVFPKDTPLSVEDIKLNQWNLGCHWYAKVAGKEVKIKGEVKWKTKEEALRRAKQFLSILKRKNTILNGSNNL